MNPILITIGSFEVRWYSALILLAVFIVLVLTQKEASRFNIPKDYIFNMLFWALIFGIIGARLYYVAFNWSEFASNPMEIFKVWNGGLAIHGGLISALICLMI